MEAFQSLLSFNANHKWLSQVPGLHVPEANFIWDVWMCMYVCISPQLPWFQVIKIKALSIQKTFHQSGIDVGEKILFHVESHVFAGKEFESKWRLYKFK